jgi:GTP1/Obg family GTP-binding protein
MAGIRNSYDEEIDTILQDNVREISTHVNEGYYSVKEQNSNGIGVSANCLFTIVRNVSTTSSFLLHLRAFHTNLLSAYVRRKIARKCLIKIRKSINNVTKAIIAKRKWTNQEKMEDVILDYVCADGKPFCVHDSGRI